jgi:DNA-binding response OmpR family regulator
VILVVDDDIDLVDVVRSALEREGFAVDQAVTVRPPCT